MIVVNGEPIIGVEGTSLCSYLETAGYSLQRIAVERNGEIIPKNRYADVVLMEGDTLEVVQFVGGG
ncbi:MAG: sulfur carrier protein ThiS [Oscillospiraceae bacterium]|jgi:sulfur carrier protein